MQPSYDDDIYLVMAALMSSIGFFCQIFPPCKTCDAPSSERP
jgi:hypothetical protein